MCDCYEYGVHRLQSQKHNVVRSRLEDPVLAGCMVSLLFIVNVKVCEEVMVEGEARAPLGKLAG